MEKIGTLRFDKSNFLGKGGFGKVYQGSYKLPGGQSTTVAVKQILQKDFRPVEDRLLRESMRHDNIVAYLAKEEDALSYYYALELCACNLRQYVSGAYRVPASQSVGTTTEILIDVTKGLRFLHSKKVVHRDVKPENILISLAENAGKAKAKLADFGLSKVQASPDGVFSNSGYKGTRCWSAPELLFTNREPFTYAIDIFSLGCVYGYCLNNGNHPFGDENNFGNICRNVQEERIVWSSEATEVDDSLKTLVSRMTLYNAEFRATLKMDAESLATDFERLEDFFEPYFPAEVMDKTSEDYQALLEVIVGTAVGEEKLTQVGLAWLVRNRTQYPGRWLSTLAGVCRQRNQFCRHGNISEALKSDEAVREIDAWLPSVYRDHSDVTDGANHCFPIMGNGGIANTPPSHFNPDAPFRDIGNLRFFRA